MNIRLKHFLIALALSAGFLIAPWRAAAEPAFTKQTNVEIKLSDGTPLAADVYLPNGVETGPVVLVRTPYGKGSKGWLAPPLAEAGFAVVVQDVRGMGASGGKPFVPFVNDKKDGLDTLTWIAKQTWCDGNIGMWGSSYLAYCALVVAPEEHPNLKAIVNISGWGDSQEMASPGGALHLMISLPWTLSSQIRGKGSFGAIDWPSAFKRLPVVEIPATLGLDAPAWDSAVQMFTTDFLQKDASISGRCNKIRIPTLHITGWHDFVGRHTLDVYEEMDSVKDNAKAPLKLVVGPWRHDQIWTEQTQVGDADFGPASAMGLEKALDLSIRWFDRWLKDTKNGITKEKPVRLFVMGENRWHDFEQWPPKKTAFQKWHLGSEGNASSSDGDGYLTLAAPKGTGSDGFTFDPMNPVPTTGGVNCHFFLDNLGVKDQREIEKRKDVLVYTSEPMRKPTRLIGPLQAVIYAATEGKHTDFTAKLVEVRKDGYARIIEDGILRGPDPIDGRKVAIMEPGKVYRFTIDLGGTAIMIDKGNRLRVEVSSSNFPKYTRNANTGEPSEHASVLIPVKQTVYHSAEYPSHIVLPVLE